MTRSSRRAGEVHALLGENGAGKSSLMNVAAGLYAPDAGTIFVDGEPSRLSGPADARRLGIGMVHQQFKLVKPFTVAENILLANRRASLSLRHAPRSAPRSKSRPHELGFDIDPGTAHRHAVRRRSSSRSRSSRCWSAAPAFSFSTSRPRC